jgi:transcriptional regulator with XRE-family HTH domain
MKTEPSRAVVTTGDLRRLAGITQTELAHLLSVSARTVQRAEQEPVDAPGAPWFLQVIARACEWLQGPLPRVWLESDRAEGWHWILWAACARDLAAQEAGELAPGQTTLDGGPLTATDRLGLARAALLPGLDTHAAVMASALGRASAVTAEELADAEMFGSWGSGRGDVPTRDAGPALRRVLERAHAMRVAELGEP